MNKHTPAPWKVKNNGKGLTPSIVTADEFTMTWEIARLKDVPNSALKYNARLIAAAPELLETLKMCEIALRYANFDGDFDGQFAVPAAQKAVRALLERLENK